MNINVRGSQTKMLQGVDFKRGTERGQREYVKKGIKSFSNGRSFWNGGGLRFIIVVWDSITSVQRDVKNK